MRLNQGERNVRMRADAAAGRTAAWIAATYDVSLSTVYRVTDGVEPCLERGDGLVVQPLAEWETALRGAGLFGSKITRKVPAPSRDWIDSMGDLAPGLPDVACVYFVQERDTNNVKIGVSATASIARRMAGLQNGNPRQLELRRLVAGDVATEARMHAYFARCWIRGEWFELDDELAEVSHATATR